MHNSSSLRVLAKEELVHWDWSVVLIRGSTCTTIMSLSTLLKFVNSKMVFLLKDKAVVQMVTPFMLQSLLYTENVLMERSEKAKNSQLNNSSIVISLADKGGLVVTMERLEYIITIILLSCPTPYEEKR